MNLQSISETKQVLCLNRAKILKNDGGNPPRALKSANQGCVPIDFWSIPD